MSGAVTCKVQDRRAATGSTGVALRHVRIRNGPGPDPERIRIPESSGGGGKIRIPSGTEAERKRNGSAWNPVRSGVDIRIRM